MSEAKNAYFENCKNDYSSALRVCVLLFFFSLVSSIITFSSFRPHVAGVFILGNRYVLRGKPCCHTHRCLSSPLPVLALVFIAEGSAFPPLVDFDRSLPPCME